MIKKTYMDNASTTQVDHRVLEAMIESYKKAVLSATALEQRAQTSVMETLGIESGSFQFTSGGTEANNIAIRRLVENNKHSGNTIMVSSIEHPSVANVMKALAQEGYKIIEIPVDETGVICLDTFKKFYDSDVILVSVMYFNNETGTRQPVEEIESFLKDKQVLFHVDAVQALGKTKLSVVGDAMTFSAHKIYGPKGVGAIYYRDSANSINVCGATKNLEGIVGFESAVKLLTLDLDAQIKKMEKLKTDLRTGLLNLDAGLMIMGNQQQAHPGILNVYFPNRDGDALVIRYDMEGISISSGSACSSGALSASHVLLAMGMEPKEAKKCVRFSIGKNTNETDVLNVLEATKRILRG